MFEISGRSAAASQKMRRLCGSSNLLTWAVEWKAFSASNMRRSHRRSLRSRFNPVYTSWTAHRLVGSAPKSIKRVKPERSAPSLAFKFETRLPYVLSNKLAVWGVDWKIHSRDKWRTNRRRLLALVSQLHLKGRRRNLRHLFVFRVHIFNNTLAMQGWNPRKRHQVNIFI